MKQKKPCNPCLSYDVYSRPMPYTCPDCKTRFEHCCGQVCYVFKKGDLSVHRQDRPFLAWDIGKLRNNRKAVYLSCPSCAAINREMASRVMDDGSVNRTRTILGECFRCSHCHFHFWAKLDGWIPLKRRT